MDDIGNRKSISVNGLIYTIVGESPLARHDRWKLIHLRDKPITASHFMALTGPDQRLLLEAVNSYLEASGSGR